MIDSTQPIPEINWFARRRMKSPKPPKQKPAAIRRAVEEADKRGLSVEPSRLASQLYISAKACQIMQTKPVGRPTTRRSYIPLNLPSSGWAEFLIFFVRANKTTTTGAFYVIPREKLPKHTSVPSTSSWLREYAEAWHLLQDETSDRA